MYYFSIYQAAFGFLASSPPDNITLNPANKRTDQSLSNFQTGIDAAAHATLNSEQLIYHTTTALIDTTASAEPWWWSDSSFRSAWAA